MDDAKKLLQESGYSGEVLTLFYFEKDAEDASWLQKRCQSVGLHLSLHPLPLADSYSQKIDREADLLLSGEVLEDDIEWGYLRQFKDGASYLYRFFNHDSIFCSRKATFHPALKGMSIDSFGWIDFSKLWINPTAQKQQIDRQEIFCACPHPKKGFFLMHSCHWLFREITFLFRYVLRNVSIEKSIKMVE